MAVIILLFYISLILANFVYALNNHDAAVFPANEDGICFKRMSYDQAISMNTTGQIKLVPGSYQGVKKGNQVWVTVTDCCDGYSYNTNTGHCESHCEGGCAGGTCTGPNICTCEEGWASEQGVCKPQCQMQCQRDAYCYSPNACRCKLGYEEDAYGQCKPVCPGNCTNGECIAPRVCRCRPGYSMNVEQQCMPVCEGCTNGICVAPGVCRCHEGSDQSPSNGCTQTGSEFHSQSSSSTFRTEQRSRTEPVCRTDCSNGVCIAPDVCQCNHGYQKDPRTQNCVSIGGTANSPSTNNPRFHCSTGCPNGRCVGPNLCLCNDGFVIDHRSNTCVDYWTVVTPATWPPRVPSEGPPTQPSPGATRYPNANTDNSQFPSANAYPVCEGCTNGQCVGPNHCVCNRGYRMDPRSRTCRPHVPSTSQNRNPLCQNGCHNGQCLGPNQCVCNQGFLMNPNTQTCVSSDTETSWGVESTSDSSSSQSPHRCRDGCPNGQCIGPNQCICNPGYIVHPSTNRCEPSRDSNQDVGRDWQNNRDRDRMCERPCMNGECVGYNHCECYRGYSSSSQDPFRCMPVCRGGCPNGVCTAPNRCLCKPGYIKDPSVKGGQNCVHVQ